MNAKDAVQNHQSDEFVTTGEDGLGTAQRRLQGANQSGSEAKPSKGKPARAMAVLGRGRSVVVIGRDLTLDSWIKTAQEAVAKARRAKTYGLELEAFLKMLRDMSRG